MKKLKTILICSFLFISVVQAASLDCESWVGELKSKASSTPELSLLITKLPLLEEMCKNPAEAEKEIFDSLWKLERIRLLEPTLLKLVKNVKATNKVPQLAKVNEQFIVSTLAAAIRSEFYDRGYASNKFKFIGWNEITQAQMRLLNSLPRTASFQSQTFKGVFEKLTNMPMTKVSQTEVLENNGLAFKKRVELIRSAQHSIKFMTWGLYDDEIGRKFVDELVAAHKRNVQVYVIVDGQVAKRPGMHRNLDRLAKSGVKVLGHFSALNPYHGMHSKMLLVDDLYCVEGGRNIGDNYLINNKWSDLDVYHKGELAEKVNSRIFAEIWNQQVNQQRLKYELLSFNPLLNFSSGDTGTVMSAPEHHKADMVSNLTLYAIRNAKSEIFIANAYFILTPGMTNELTAALKRGVRVTIYSNSIQSVDEPIVSVPIQKSLREMFQRGAQIYIKNGQTLHTKIFRADDLAWVGSYNLHPRSARFELEKVIFTTNKELVRNLDQALSAALRQGTRVNRLDQVAVPNMAGLDILLGMIFNQL